MLNRFLRKVFYWPIRLTAQCNPIPYEPLKQYKIDKNKPTVYVTVSSSVANLLTIERLTEQLELPSPFEPLHIGGKEVVRTGYLRNPPFLKGSKARETDIAPILHDWLKVTEETGQSLQIIPVTVLWSRDPSYEGLALRGVNNPTPSWKKFLTVTFSGGNNCTIVGNPLDSLKFKEEIDRRSNPKLLRRFVELYFLKQARTVTGKPFPNREKLIEEIIKRPAVQAAMEKEMAEHGGTKESLTIKARGILNVMVADTRYSLLNFFNRILSCIWKKIYHGQTILGADRVRSLVANGHEIIYIPCHRSHMDYILLTFVIFHEGLPIPQIASGDNLNFFPIGPIIRRSGSYFIRRKMKGDNFYIAIFSEYLSVLFERGYATEFFIEGGRSRTGRTLPPRTGMVAMTVEAQLRGIERPIAFVPTYLGYEHVTEVHSYMQELKGVAKKKESAAALLGIFKRLRNYGRGYVTFGEPVIVPRFLSQNVPDWRKDIDPTGLGRPDWLFDTVNQMAYQIIMNLNDSATINGINLCALAIMSDRDHTMSTRMLSSCLNMYLTVLRVDSRRASQVPNTPASMLIKQALELKKFHIYDVGDDMKFVRPSHGQSLQLTYFMNNIVHLFALPALVANILIRNGHILRSEVRVHTRSLFYFLRHELFALVPEENLDILIEKYIDTYLEEGYITQSGAMLFLSGDNYDEFYILSNCIRPNLVRYLVAVTALHHTDNNSLDVEGFINKCIIYSKRLPVEVTENSPEFADPIVFKIMCHTFVRHNYFSLNDDKTISINYDKVKKLSRAAEPLLAAKVVRILNGNSLVRQRDSLPARKDEHVLHGSVLHGSVTESGTVENGSEKQR